MTSYHMSINPNLIIRIAREMILDKSINDAIVFLIESLEGMTVDYARKILAGDATINDSMELVNDDDVEWKKILENTFSDYYHLSGKKVFKIISYTPSARLNNKELNKWKDAYNRGLINEEFISGGCISYGRLNVDLIQLQNIIGDYYDRKVMVEYSDTIVYDPILRIKDFVKDYCDKVKISEAIPLSSNSNIKNIDFPITTKPEKDTFYWLDKKGVLTIIPYCQHDKFCEIIGISVEEYEQNNIRIHKPDGLTRMVASTMQDKYTDKQIEVLSCMPWVTLDLGKFQ